MENVCSGINRKEWKELCICNEISNQDNLIAKFKIKGIKTAIVCGTRKKAKELVSAWNTSYRDNGTYLYDEPSF